MKTVITEHIHNVTKRVLNEYFSVSMYLKDAVFDALDILDVEMKKRQNYKMARWTGNGNSLMLYSIEFMTKMNLLESDLYFNVKICVFKDKKNADFARNTLGNLTDIYYNGDRREIVINTSVYDPDFNYHSDVISAYELSNFAPQIAHEMMHAYQHTKRIKAQSPNEEPAMVDNYKNRQIYGASQYLMSFKNSDAQMIGYAIYYATTVEISAFIQQLFTEILYSDSYQSAINILDGSDYVENMDKLSATIEMLKANCFEPEFLKFVERILNRPCDWLIKYLEKGHKRMLQGYGKLKTIIRDVWLNNKKNRG